MPSKFHFWCIFGGFSKENGGLLAPTSDQKSMSTSKGGFCKKYWKTNTVSMIFQVWGGRSWPQKSIKNWSLRWIASWYRFLLDFGGFREAGWEGKSNQEWTHIDSKTHQKWNLEGIDFLFDFCIDFLSMFLRFGTSTWSYVGPQDAAMTPPKRLPRRVRDNMFPDTFPDTLFLLCLVDF